VWIFVKEQTPRRRLLTYDQQINELFPSSPLFELKEVTDSDVRLWQEKFHSSVASATRLQSEHVIKWEALALYPYNPEYLNDINQIILPSNEPAQTVQTTSQNGLLQFLETASCQPITPNVVLYNRIFKTGSETTGALFNFVAAMMNYIYTRGKYSGDFLREFD